MHAEPKRKNIVKYVGLYLIVQMISGENLGDSHSRGGSWNFDYNNNAFFHELELEKQQNTKKKKKKKH